MFYLNPNFPNPFFVHLRIFTNPSLFIYRTSYPLIITHVTSCTSYIIFPLSVFFFSILRKCIHLSIYLLITYMFLNIPQLYSSSFLPLSNFFFLVVYLRIYTLYGLHELVQLPSEICFFKQCLCALSALVLVNLSFFFPSISWIYQSNTLSIFQSASLLNLLDSIFVSLPFNPCHVMSKLTPSSCLCDLCL